jgi:hypothetical protein
MFIACSAKNKNKKKDTSYMEIDLKEHQWFAESILEKTFHTRSNKR